MPANRHSSEELGRIFEEIAGKGFWVPLTPGTEMEVGPLSMVYLRYSDLVPQAGALQERYLKALRNVPRQGALAVLAFINNILMVGTGRAHDVHRALNEKFLLEELRAKVAEYKLEQLPRPARPAFPVVFNRVGCLQLMRHLMLHGRDSIENGSVSVETVGELALLGNEFVQPDSLPAAPGATSSEVPLQFVPAWDFYNPSDLAYALPRMFTILTEILPGGDNEVRKLCAKLEIDPSSLTVDGIGLVDFLSVVFGLYAFGKKVEQVGKDAVVFDYKRAFERTCILPAVEQFVAKRGLTLTDYRRQLESETPASQEALLEEIKERSFLSSGLNIFRHFPLLTLEGSRVAILDLQFLVDLLTSGVYWSIFDNLPKSRRETFQQLWGRLFELYAVGLLRDFYPPLSGFLKADLAYKGGQIDALLDFGGEVIVFETKSSLLSEAAKRKGDLGEFEGQVNLKFVRNEAGNPKAVLQLVKSCRSIAAGVVPTTLKPNRIYPVLLGEEPALQTLGFNTYLNDVFQKELGHDSVIRPLTVMTIEEFEETLAYVSPNVFSWAELLETRFANGDVIGHSVHQAIYDWRHSKEVGLHRNEVLLRQFKEIFQRMKERYQFQE